MQTAMEPYWRIVHLRERWKGLYQVILECGAQSIVAIVRINNRAEIGEPPDWAVHVEYCDDPSADAWLRAHEREYAIGNLCKRGRVP